MATAFQSNAFQSDAFQIESGAVEPEVPGGRGGLTTLVPGPRSRWYSKDDLWDIIQALIGETEVVAKRKVAKRKKPEAVIKAVKRALRKENVELAQLKELAVLWDEGAERLQERFGDMQRAEELAVAIELQLYFREQVRLRDEDDVATLMALGEL